MSKPVHLSNQTYMFLKRHQINGETIDAVIKRLLNVVTTNDITVKSETTGDDIQKDNKYYDDTNSGYIR